ncbi:hypothetical protein ACOMHN_050853 [Nucella lapillus]
MGALGTTTPDLNHKMTISLNWSLHRSSSPQPAMVLLNSAVHSSMSSNRTHSCVPFIPHELIYVLNRTHSFVPFIPHELSSPLIYILKQNTVVCSLHPNDTLPKSRGHSY